MVKIHYFFEYFGVVRLYCECYNLVQLPDTEVGDMQKKHNQRSFIGDFEHFIDSPNNFLFFELDSKFEKQVNECVQLLVEQCVDDWTKVVHVFLVEVQVAVKPLQVLQQI